MAVFERPASAPDSPNGPRFDHVRAVKPNGTALREALEPINQDAVIELDAYRALVGQKDYYKRFGGAGQWKGVQIHEVTCEPERCTVRLRLTSTLNVPRFRGQELTGYIDETWVRADGQWWFYQAL